MPDSTEYDARRTVGSLLGVPLGFTPSPPAAQPAPAQDEARALPAAEFEGPGWSVRRGQVGVGEARAAFDAAGVETLDYNNPFSQLMERVWFDGKVVFAVDLGAVDVDPARVKVAQEYQVVYDVELDEQGHLAREPEPVPGQFNIYDSVPGMPEYSPIWQFNYVVVPRSYRPNALRSEGDCLRSGYPVHRAAVFEN